MQSKYTAFIIASLLPLCAAGQMAVSSGCPRFPVGSKIMAPADVYSVSGILRVNFEYQTSVDENGNTLFCFINSDGSEAPTLHVNPGDRIIIALANRVPAQASGVSETSGVMMSHMNHMRQMAEHVEPGKGELASSMVAPPVLELNTPPTCHQDEVIRTMINSGERFEYDLKIPSDEPSGLYWYHPHVRGISEAAVQGGASGAIVVEGLENINPSVAGLPQQLLIVRDNHVPAMLKRTTHPHGICRSTMYPFQSPITLRR
jgi:FtsP/CotA-like multicopper oxidase with cupredoxin domain